jgi:hypothetical protein
MSGVPPEEEEEQPTFEITQTEEINAKLLSSFAIFLDRNGPPIPIPVETPNNDFEENSWSDDE